MGSLFHDLVFEKTLAPRGTIDNQMVVLNTLLAEYYTTSKTNKNRVTRICLSDFCNANAPHLKYPSYSSGSMSKDRGLAAFGQWLCHTFGQAGSQRDAQRTAAFDALASILDVIYSGDTHLGDAAVARLQFNVDACLAHVSYFNWEARQRKRLLYNITYKFHYLWHLAQEATFINPRIGGCCYANEDMMGKLAGLARGCTTGTNSLKVAQSILDKYIRAIAVQWAEYDG